MIGNDLIALNVSRFSSKERLERYWNKITSLQEQQLYAPSELLLWKLWGLKESVFKAESRRVGAHSFRPSQINCTLINSIKAEVVCENQMYLGCVNTRADQLHIHVVDNQFNNVDLFFFNGKSSSFNHKLLHCFSFKVNTSANNVRIVKTKGIPWIIDSKTNQQYAISLSHHGGYSSACFNLIAE